MDFPQVIYKTQWQTEGVRGAGGDPMLKQTFQQNLLANPANLKNLLILWQRITLRI